MRWPYCENDRVQAERATDRHVKVVTDARGSVLGATIGAHAGEPVTPWALAIGQGRNIRAMAEMVFLSGSSVRSTNTPLFSRRLQQVRRYGA